MPPGNGVFSGWIGDSRSIWSWSTGVVAVRSSLNEMSGERTILPASAVVLSTGGAGQVYARTTNPGNATGDGMAMALRAGALLMDMEFVQFHPTSLYLPSSPPFLLSEAILRRGGAAPEHQGVSYSCIGTIRTAHWPRVMWFHGRSGRKWRRRARDTSIWM